MTALRPGPTDSLVDVEGLAVGHHQRVGDGWLTGTTVVVAPAGGAVAGVDVRGGGPGTRESDALDPRNLVERFDAVVLTGGSAFGLAAADGVMARLAALGRGYPMLDGDTFFALSTVTGAATALAEFQELLIHTPGVVSRAIRRAVGV